jgi:hypothetical protein
LKTLLPIYTARLCPPLVRKLVALLRSLAPEQWLEPTCYPNWKVKDIASHLLQTGISRLSGQRDAWSPGLWSGPMPAGFTEVANLIARNNKQWEKWTLRREAAAWRPYRGAPDISPPTGLTLAYALPLRLIRSRITARTGQAIMTDHAAVTIVN